MKYGKRGGERLELSIVIGLWLLFICLCIYAILSWRKVNFEGEYTPFIRKLWYLVFIAGCLMVLTGNPTMFFANWQNFVMALAAFIIIDALLFLNLHVSKLGGNELTSTKVQVGVTQQELDDSIKKSGRIPAILISFEFPVYTLDKAEYINQLESLLGKYGKEESLEISLLPYGSPEEQAYLLDSLGNYKNRAERHLKRFSSLSLKKDTIALYPFMILDYPYVAHVEADGEENKISEVDGIAISSLVIAYNLTVVFGNENESGES